MTTRLALLLPLTGALLVSQTPSADLVLLNGTVITVDARDSIVEALAVKDGRIVFVGSNTAVRQHIGEKTETIDLARTHRHAWTDRHARPLLGASRHARSRRRPLDG